MLDLAFKASYLKDCLQLYELIQALHSMLKLPFFTSSTTAVRLVAKLEIKFFNGGLTPLVFCLQGEVYAFMKGGFKNMYTRVDMKPAAGKTSLYHCKNMDGRTDR